MPTADHISGNTLATVLTTTLAHEAHELVRHLGDVLDLRPQEHVLFLPGDGGISGLTLAQTFDCQVTILSNGENPVEPNDPRITVQRGTLQALPFADGSFDAVIVATPVTGGLLAAGRELARVLRRNGRLGMVALSPYRDQVSEEISNFQQMPLMSQTRPTAAYRAVLGEAGFTAFVVEDRRREVRRSAAALYREHLLRDEPRDPALGLLANGGLSVTLLTAEKST